MKKILCINLIVLILASIFTFPVFANETEVDNGNPLPAWNTEEMKEEIVNFINSSYYGEIPYNLTTDDIDFSGAYKIFVDTNIFEIQTNNYDELLSILEAESVRIYEVPVFLDNGDVYVANLSINLPLNNNARKVMTDSEIKNYLSTVGSWSVSVMYKYPKEEGNYVEYNEMLKSEIEEFGQPILVGSLPYFRDAVALFRNPDGNVGKVVPLNPSTVQWDKLLLQENANINDYSQLKASIKRSESVKFIPIIVVIGLVIVLIVMGKRRKE